MGGSRARVVWSGVDRLDLFSRAVVSPDVVGRLRVLHGAGRKGKRVATIDLGGEEFQIARRQARHGALLLRSAHMVVTLHPGARGLRPRMTFELGARCLALLGPAAVERARAVLRDLTSGQPADSALHLSRIDLAADLQGWTVRAPDLRRFRTRARRTRDHEGTRQFTGFTFGRKALLARIYDKTTEVAWARNVWAPGLWEASTRYRPGEPVWRVEYQVRRPALTSFARLRGRGHLDTWEDAREAIPALWRYLSTGWLSLRLPRTGKSRQRFAPPWQRVIDDAFACGPWSGKPGTLSRIAVRVAARPDSAALDRCILREVAVRLHLGDRTAPLDGVVDSILGEARARIAGSPRLASAAMSRYLARFRQEEQGSATQTGGIEAPGEGGRAA